MDALDTTYRVVQRYEMKNGRKNLSFLESATGIYTLGAIINNHIGDTKSVNFFVEKVKEYYFLCFDKFAQYELQNGVAGYLYCLLALHECIQGQDLQGYIVNIVN